MADKPATAVSDKLIAALVVSLERIQARMGEISTEVKRLRDAEVEHTGEIRRLTDATRELEQRVSPIVTSDEARGRALGKVFDRLTRLTWAQAGAMVVAMVAVPVTVWATIMGLTHPGDFGELVIRIVTIVADDQPTPVLPEGP